MLWDSSETMKTKMSFDEINGKREVEHTPLKRGKKEKKRVFVLFKIINFELLYYF